MKKIVSTGALLIVALSYGQVDVSVKANLLFPTGSPSWKNISQSAVDAYESGGKEKAGFNAGLAVKVGLISNLFIQPEIYYTTFSNKFTDPVSNTTLEAKSNRADLPILVGYDLLGETFGIFAGPVASYNLSKEDQYNDFKENAKNSFTLGYQFGAQLAIKKLIITGRYEGAFTEDQRDYINSNTNQTIRYDNRPSLFLAGVGYKF